MKLIADQKRRVVLPKPVAPGDVLEVTEAGDRIVLLVLKRPSAIRPPVAEIPLDPVPFAMVDLDEPAFEALSHEGIG